MVSYNIVVSLLVIPLTIGILLQGLKSLADSPHKNREFDISENIMPRTPVFALSHGGPTFMYGNAGFGGDKGAFECTRELGRHIKEVIKPKFIVYVSAHWQSKAKNQIEIAVPLVGKPLVQGPPQENSLIYDFYGFPKYMYDEEFHSMNDISIARLVAADINSFFSKSQELVHASLAKRGIDHGVWVPLKVAFPDDANNYWNIEIPIVQVSLTADDTDFETHYKLGQALSKYRSQGGLVVVSGMSVHNLRDLGSVSGGQKALPYVKKFNQVLADILINDEKKNKLSQIKDLLANPSKRELLYSAHPTLEHFMPFVVGLGAGEGPSDEDCEDKYHVKELYNNEQGSLGWGIYQFGK